jgi:glycosyltransferase involved in cell wall biosynthesis
MNKKISVIVNCHNGEKFLEKCVVSILNQKYLNLEIIFFDNASTDSSKDLISNFKDKRIKYFFNKKKIPLYQARNKAIKFSTGDLISFLDVDDWWDENYLSSRLSIFENENFDYFYTNVYLYYDKNKKKKIYKTYNLPNGKIYNFLAKDYFIIISALIIRRSAIHKSGYFNKNFNIIGDFDLLMRISEKFNAHATNTPLVFYRQHKKNFSKLNTDIFYYEFNNWYKAQILKKNINFFKNVKFFKKKLLGLEIIYLLFNKSKNFYLFNKILRYPNYYKKIIYLIAFFIPKKIIFLFR